MSATLDAIIEFLTTYHKGGRHGGTYGWVYVLAVAISIGSALAARELRARRARVQRNVEGRCATGPLRAAAVVEGDGDVRIVEGRVQAVGGAYELILRESRGGRESETRRTFPSIECLEAFLASHTVLRLGDFKED